MNFPSSYLHCSCLPLPGTVIPVQVLKDQLKFFFNRNVYPQIDHSGGVVDHFAFTAYTNSMERIDMFFQHLQEEFGELEYHIQELPT